ncbi:MAG: NAD(P)-dependent glycerol-3-phosphate dehydrogenase [Endomicrobia bacterium]|nr:NAD(P)-dependent glycerol-3-phosphate dehydrogenase [Endomicrobiia bacterium]
MKMFILGAGCWGATLASIYAQKGFKIELWEANKERFRYLIKHRHPKYYNFIKLPKSVSITNELEKLYYYPIIMLAIPSVYVRETLEKIKNLNIKDKTFISCTKGLEINTLKTPSQIINEVLSINYKNILTFSGPSHAEEVALKKPTAIILAGKNPKLLKELQRLLSTEFLRIYINSDIIGVEIAGAIKNIYAIAAGICDGLQLGNNAKSSLLTRALKEMLLIGKILGGNPKTFIGLAGLGDLLTTSYSRFSRNRNFGEYLAIYKDIKKAKQKIKTSIEGLFTLKAIYKLSKSKLIELPIVEELYKIVYKNKNPQNSIKTLLSRKLKKEFYGYQI